MSGEIKVPDCGGHPCIFGNRGGQRTQGGCGCLKSLPINTQRYILHIVKKLSDLEDIDKVCDYHIAQVGILSEENERLREQINILSGETKKKQ